MMDENPKSRREKKKTPWQKKQGKGMLGTPQGTRRKLAMAARANTTPVLPSTQGKGKGKGKKST